MATIVHTAQNLLKTKPKHSNYRFVYFGDSWFDWGKTRAEAITRYQIFLGALETAAKQKPMFILIGGDVVFSGTEPQLKYVSQKLNEFMSKHKIPVFIAPGNHERTGTKGSLDLYRKYISGRLNYKVDAPNLRIMLLNDIGPGTAVSGDYKKYYGFDQSGTALATLKSGLATAGSRKVVVVMHVPPKTGTWTRANGTTFKLKNDDGFPINTPKNRDFLNTLKKNKNKVQKVLVGHVHDYATSKIDGIPYIIEGQGGAVIGNNSIVLLEVNKGIVSAPKRILIKRSQQVPNKVFVNNAVLPNP